MLLHSVSRGRVRKFVQSVVYLPHFVSWMIVVALFSQMFGVNGVVNGLFGGGAHMIDVFSEPDLFKPLMVVELLWKDCGWGTIIFLAACTRSTTRSTRRPRSTEPVHGGGSGT